jgi:hypothetical protein
MTKQQRSALEKLLVAYGHACTLTWDAYGEGTDQFEKITRRELRAKERVVRFVETLDAASARRRRQ